MGPMSNQFYCNPCGNQAGPLLQNVFPPGVWTLETMVSRKVFALLCIFMEIEVNILGAWRRKRIQE